MTVYMSADMAEIAMENLDVAIAGLKALNRYRLPREAAIQDKLRLAHYICTYSRFVHVNIWLYRISINMVKEEIIREFRKARARIKRILQQIGELSQKQTRKLERYARNVLGRERNVLDRYCKGLPSAFDLDIKDPPISLRQVPKRGNKLA